MHRQRFPVPWAQTDEDGRLAGRIWLTSSDSSPYGWAPFTFSGSRTICNYRIHEIPRGCVPGIKDPSGICFLASEEYAGFRDGTDTLAIAYLDELPDTSVVHLYIDNGICGTDTYYATLWGYIKDKKDSFVVSPNDSIFYAGRIACNLETPDILIEPWFNPIPAEHVNATPEAFDALIQQLADLLVSTHQNALAGISDYSYSNSPNPFHYIIDHTQFSSNYAGDDQVVRMEHKLAYLQASIQTGFYVLYMPTQFTFSASSFNQIAALVIQRANIAENIVVVTVPYTFRQSYPGSDLSGYIMPGFGSNYGETFMGLKESNFEGKRLYDIILAIYASLEKPYNQYVGYLRYDGTTTFRKIPHTPFRGKDKINELLLYWDEANIMSYLSADEQRLAACASEHNTDQCRTAMLHFEQLSQELALAENRDYAIFEQNDLLKEAFFDHSTGLAHSEDYYAHKYALYEYSKASIPLPNYLIDFFSSPLPNVQAVYPNSELYQIVYDALDLVSLAGAPLGLDVVGDAMGLIAAQFDDQPDRRILMSSVYGASVLISGVPSLSFKQVAAGNNYLLIGSQNKLITAFTQEEEVIEFFAGQFGRQIDPEIAGRIIQNPALSETLVSNKLLRDLAGNAPNGHLLLDDLAQHSGLMEAMDENPFLVQAWELVTNAIHLQSGVTQFARDLPTLNRISAYLSSVNAVKLNAAGGIEGLTNFISKNADVPCQSCSGGVPVFHGRKMDEIIENFVEGAYHFREYPEHWQQLLAGSLHPLPAMREGTQHTLQIIRQHPDKYAAFKIEGIDLKFEELPADIDLCPNCRYDIRFKAEFVSEDIPLVSEFKSYQASTWADIYNSEAFLQQFKRYLQEIDHLDKLQYVYNTSKASLNEVKSGFKELFEQNATEFFKPINQGGLGIEKIKQLFGNEIDNLPDFLELIEDINSQAYNFIKMK